MVWARAKGHVFMKVIFLDIDGVLNCHKTPNPRKFPYVIDDGLLARFRQLIERTGASVVLSSTWRYDQQASSAPSTTAFPS
jgi:histidinol phosphatase-like enzyme